MSRSSVNAEVSALSQTSEPEGAELQGLLGRRRQLVEERVCESNRLDKGLSNSVRDQTRRHIAWLDDELKRLAEQCRDGGRERGKLGKVALVAVMRKLLLQLNAIAQRGTPWVNQHPAAT